MSRSSKSSSGPKRGLSFRIDPCYGELHKLFNQSGYSTESMVTGFMRLKLGGLSPELEAKYQGILKEKEKLVTRLAEIEREAADLLTLKAKAGEAEVRFATDGGPIPDLSSYWDQFREKYPTLSAPPDNWNGDGELHPWFQGRGIEATFHQVYQYWKKNEEE